MLKAISVGLGCALACSALADDRAAHDLPLLAQQSSAPLLFESCPAADAQLAQLRARLAVPLVVRETSVILWDEPRTGVPPRGTQDPAGASGVSAAGSIYRK